MGQPHAEAGIVARGNPASKNDRSPRRQRGVGVSSLAPRACLGNYGKPSLELHGALARNTSESSSAPALVAPIGMRLGSQTGSQTGTWTGTRRQTFTV